MKILLIILVFLTPLLGCTSTPIPLSDAKQVPLNKIFTFRSKTGQNNANIVIVRDAGLLGMPCSIKIHINHKLAAILEPEEYASFFVEPDEVIIRYGPIPSLTCPPFWNWKALEANLKPNEKRTYRVTSTSGDWNLTRLN